MRLRSPFNEYEKAFISRMARLQRSGYDFGGGSRQALESKFGGAAEVLLRDLSEQARNDPTLFVTELTHTFGRGSIGFMEPVLKWADRGLFPPATPAQSAYSTIASRLPEGGDGEEEETIPLHEHRVKDDEGRYSDEYD